MNNKTKQKIIKKFQTHKNDTGSTEVQIAILSKEIDELSAHLKKNIHDYSSRRGLFKKICQRKKLIKYLHKENIDSLYKIAQILKLKIAKSLKEELKDIMDLNKKNEEKRQAKIIEDEKYNKTE
ncbi:MAG: 30S ribosomal protein S15 [Xanthomonadaceae bacterium]|nr:30S ribosomal protein S15 [Rhodospirillaceae bacterium]NIA17945.1 30S ribosomal protein S15 [Xanthomonadaceae bacterium]